jgi:hypothetical protein
MGCSASKGGDSAPASTTKNAEPKATSPDKAGAGSEKAEVKIETDNKAEGGGNQESRPNMASKALDKTSSRGFSKSKGGSTLFGENSGYL